MTTVENACGNGGNNAAIAASMPNPPAHDNRRDYAHPSDMNAITTLSRWITELRTENAGLKRENEWHRQTLARRWDRIRQLERRVAQLDNHLHRFWMDTYTPEQARDLARELVS